MSTRPKATTTKSATPSVRTIAVSRTFHHGRAFLDVVGAIQGAGHRTIAAELLHSARQQANREHAFVAPIGESSQLIAEDVDHVAGCETAQGLDGLLNRLRR